MGTPLIEQEWFIIADWILRHIAIPAGLIITIYFCVKEHISIFRK